MEKQFELFEEGDLDERSEEATEDAMNENAEEKKHEDEKAERTEEEKPRKKRETIRSVQETMGYAPFLTAEEREKKKTGPGRAEWLELKKKLTEK